MKLRYALTALFVAVGALTLIGAGTRAPVSLPANCQQIGTTLAGNTLWECLPATATATPTLASSTPTVSPSDTVVPPTLTPVPPSATATKPAPTASATPTATNQVALVPWHAPGSHLDPISHLPLPIHEHGDAPPAWVNNATGCPVPFSQVREGHVFYKGMLASDQGGRGVQSYLITHVATTVTARSHGDHDYMIFFLTPVTGRVSCIAGLLDFGSPPITRTVDTGERPIILSRNESGLPGFSNCETWYGRPGALVFDLGWQICNRWQSFSGTVLGGNGAYRGSDWHVYTDRFPQWPAMDPGLAQYAVDDGFGHKRLDFVRTGIEFPDTGVAGPN